MVWIHGGGFTAGDGAAYDPTGLVEEGNVIVATINYRLGALGLFAHPALDAENHLLAHNSVVADAHLAADNGSALDHARAREDARSPSSRPREI